MKDLIPVSIYMFLVFFVEVALYYLVEKFEVVANFAMPLEIVLFLVVAWVLKLRILAAISAILMVSLYGILSFYSDFPIYYIGYPDDLVEFLPFIGIKSVFYAFPLVAYLVLGKKKSFPDV